MVVNEELRREVRWDRKNVVDTRGGARYTHTHFHGRLTMLADMNMRLHDLFIARSTWDCQCGGYV